MLWTNHSKPVVARSPLDMLLQRERLRGDTRPGTPHLPTGDLDAGMRSLQFKVRYGLPEYISFTWQHCGYLIRRRRIGALATWWLCFKSTASAALHFVLQGRARRTYDFTIDEHGIVRASGTGVTLVPWRDVSAVRRYSCGYMLVLARGTLPVPFRCLDRMQIAAMDGFAAMVRAAARR